MELFFELLISIVYRTVPILSLNWGYYAKSLNVLYSLTELGCVNIYMRYRYTVNNSFSRNCWERELPENPRNGRGEESSVDVSS